MKKILMAIGVLLVIFMLFMSYGVYLNKSDESKIRAISKASEAYFKTKGSLTGYCGDESVAKLKSAGMQVMCEEEDGGISMQIQTDMYQFSCTKASYGPDRQGVLCVKMPDLSDRSVNSDTVPMYEVSETQIVTLAAEPPFCDAQSDFDRMRRGGSDIDYSVNPGVYSASLTEGDKRLLLYIGSDRSVCQCKQLNPENGPDFSFQGAVDMNGYVVWDDEKSWENPDTGHDRSLDGKRTFVTLNGKNVLDLYIDSKNCGDVGGTWFPADGVSPEEVCGCRSN